MYVCMYITFEVMYTYKYENVQIYKKHKVFKGWLYFHLNDLPTLNVSVFTLKPSSEAFKYLMVFVLNFIESEF